MVSRVLVIIAISCCLQACLAQAPVEAPGVGTNATTVVRTNWNSVIIEDACSTSRTAPCVPLVRNIQRSRFTVTPAAARSYPTGLVLPGFFVYGGINGTYLNDLTTDYWFLLADFFNDSRIIRDTIPTPRPTILRAGAQFSAGATIRVPSSGGNIPFSYFFGGLANSSDLTTLIPLFINVYQDSVTSIQHLSGNLASYTFRGTAVSAGNTMILFGGNILPNATDARPLSELRVSNTLSFVQYFSPTNTTFEEILAPNSGWPAPRYDHASIVYNSTKMIVFGGAFNSSVFYNDTWIYDIPSRTWTQATPRIERAVNDTNTDAITLPYRAGHQLVQIRDKYTNTTKILCIGGYGPGMTGRTDVWEYEPDANVWRVLNATGPNPPARWHFGVAQLTDHQFLMFGGEDSTKVHNDAFHFNYWSRDAYPTVAAPTAEVVQPPFIRYPLNPRSDNNWIAIGAAVILAALIVIVIILYFIERRV